LNNPIVELEARIARIERQLRFANKQIEATVERNEDPERPGYIESRNRIRVSCPDVYGQGGLSPWLTSRSDVNGEEFGSIFTPKVGSKVYITLRDGNPDAGEYFGGPRGEDSKVPAEFEEVNVNGLKTAGGIIVIYNDDDGSYSFETDGGMLLLHQDGTMDLYGIKCNVHMKTDLNSDETQYGVVTGSPKHMCPFMGKPHFASSTCQAAE